MKRVILTFILSVFLVINLISQTKKDFIIGVENIKYYPIYNWDGKDYTGYAKELFDSFAAKKGYTFKYVALPVARLFNDFLSTDSLDFKFPDNPYWSSDAKKGKNVIYSKSVSEYIDGVIVIPERKGYGVEKLKTLGTVMGFTAWEYLDMISSKAILLKESTDFVGLLQQTMNKNIDGAYINITVADYTLNEVLKKPKLLTFDDKLPYTKSSYFISTIKYPQVIEEFNKFLESDKVEVNKLKNKYKVEESVKNFGPYKK
ncbi:MAG TPA: transporter substrate-binding domain-containing protein [Spirochaetota bacterium]|nr:transporter substrate-binding domain-containing protein [Spirochaetota bacterium]